MPGLFILSNNKYVNDAFPLNNIFRGKFPLPNRLNVFSHFKRMIFYVVTNFVKGVQLSSEIQIFKLKTHACVGTDGFDC